MSRTYKSKPHFEYDEDDGEYYLEKAPYCTEKHSSNVSKWVFYEDFWPMDVRNFRLKVPHTNKTKDKWYEMCYNECTRWEVDKMAEQMDAKAMDKEWTRMQDEIMEKNADVKCGCGWTGVVDELEVGFVVLDEEYGRTVCHCPRCGSYYDYTILG